MKIHLGSLRPFRFALIGATVGAVPWLPALGVPFWQDDYANLWRARDAIASGAAWSGGWLPGSNALFWRPLGSTLPWRLIAGALGGAAVPAHVISLVLAILSGAAVGWCASVIAARAGAPRRPAAAAFWGALLYTVHQSRLLPVAWVSAASDSMMVLWAALALGCGLSASRTSMWLALPLFAAALLSKEAAIMLPAMAFVLWWWLRSDRPGAHFPASKVMAAAVFAIAAIWLALRINLTAAPPPESPYAIQAGLNVFRNAAALAAFFAGLPRESLRYVIDTHSLLMAAWGAACVLLQAGALVLFARSARLTWRAIVALTAVAVIGAAPYVPLRWNCYEYYLSLSLVSYGVLAALGRHDEFRFRAGVTLAVAAAILSASVVYRLPHPSILGRAHDADAWLARAADLVRHQPLPASLPRLYVRVEDDDRYFAMGRAEGLAIRMGLQPGDIRELSGHAPLPAGDRGRAPVLRIGRGGVTLSPE